MSDATGPEIGISPLSGDIECAVYTVHVHIYRPVGSAGEWTLIVRDHDGSLRVWDATFPDDEAAYRAFEDAVVADGLGSVRRSS